MFQPGLLAEAHRGVLYVDEINLLEPSIANLLFTVVDGGVNRVEREGISFRHPCRPLLIATYNPAEGELRPHLIDRLAPPWPWPGGVAAPDRRRSPPAAPGDPGAAAAALPGGGGDPRRRGGPPPRSVRRAPGPGPGGPAGSPPGRLQRPAPGRGIGDPAPRGRPGTPAAPEQPCSAAIPDAFLFSPEGVLLDPHLLAQAARGLRRHGKAGGGGLVRSPDRGRYVKPMLPQGPIHHVAIDATLRAAAPHQRARRRAAPRARRGAGAQLLLREDDLRVKQLVRKAGALVIFVVDASGSMALNRMQAAKGAALQLLAEAYRSRDQVALISFRGRRAEVLLPPSRSITAASRRLEWLACGGGSPLAHGLALAVRLGANARQAKDVGEILIVVISDGKANVSLSRSLAASDEDGPEQLSLTAMRQELLGIAAAIRRQGMELLVIDTGNRHLASGLAADLALHGGGRHQPLPQASQREITATTRGLLGHGEGGFGVVRTGA